MSRVAALAGGRTNAGPPWGLWRTGSLYHACQGPARLFRFVASLCREQMFAVICLSHKNKDTNCLQISRSHPRPLLLQERLCVLLAKAPPPAPVLPGLRCKPWELIPFLVAAHPRGGADLALCL